MNEYDVVIIGGGVIGASVAYYLSFEDLKVALLEKGDIASGTSSSCEGNLLISDKQPGIDTTMTFKTLQLLKELAERVPRNLEYVQPGSLLVIESQEELMVAKNLVKDQVKDGYPMRILSRQEILEQEPYLAKDIIGAVEIDCDAALNPMAFVFGLVEEAERNGVEVFRFCGAKDIKRDKQGAIKEVVTRKGSLKTKAVVNCAGVWAPEIARMVGVNIPIEPRQGQILVTEQTVKVARRKVMEFSYMMAKFGIKNYKRNVDKELEEMGIALVLEPTHAGNFLFGSSRAFVGFNRDVSVEVMEGIARRALRFFPVLKHVNIIRAYAGLRPHVPDHFPIISGVDGVPGFYIAAGHEGDGIGLSLSTGLLMKQMISKEKTFVPVEEFSYSRFN